MGVLQNYAFVHIRRGREGIILCGEEPMKTRIHEPFNAISHFAAAGAALLGTVLLLAWHGSTPTRAAAILIYGASLVGLFLASGTYHSLSASPRAGMALRKVDHTAIYVLIAGTYTPFCLVAFTGFWKWGLLAVIWALALAGIIVKLFIIRTPRWVTAGVYIVMGWLSVAAAGEFLRRLEPATFGWMLAGGLLYTFGAIIYITKKGDFYPGVFGFHEVWHIFVILGAAAHFIAVAGIF
jgi:hemolysin III